MSSGYMKLANELVIDHVDKRITIDGERFPYFIADEPIRVDMISGCKTAWIPIMVDTVTVVDHRIIGTTVPLVPLD
jgi:hypothetical protein